MCVSRKTGEFFRWEDQNPQSDWGAEEQALDVLGGMEWDKAAKLGRTLYPMLCGVLRLDPVAIGSHWSSFK